jgi:penicillin-binding protein 1A
MDGVHKDVLVPDGKYKTGDWFTKPSGIQSLNVNGKTDIWPSWYVKPKDGGGEQMTFDKVSKKKATNCTPESAKVQQTVTTQLTGPGKYKITATVNQGTFGLQSVNITADGTQVSDQAISSPGSVTAEYTFTSSGSKTVVATVTDQGYYTASDTKTLTVTVAAVPSALAGLSNDRSWIFRNAITTGRS